MESAPNQVQPPMAPGKLWLAAAKASFIWIVLGSALSGLFALMDEFRLSQPFDNLAEALVVIIPLSVPVVAEVWHRSWRITVLLLATLLVVGLCFVAFIVIGMALFGGGWAK